MKAFILSLFFLTSFNLCKAQIKLVELKTFDAKKVLSNLEEFKSYSFEKYSLMTYLFTNESGSAHIIGSDEVSSSILIVKSEFGEHEIPKFYMIKNILNPKILNIKENEITIQLSGNELVKKYLF